MAESVANYAAEEAYYSDDLYDYAPSEEVAYEGETTSMEASVDIPEAVESNRKLIRTVNITAETREFDYDSYISEYDGDYKIHSYTYNCDEPLSNSEFYFSFKHFHLQFMI